MHKRLTIAWCAWLLLVSAALGQGSSSPGADGAPDAAETHASSGKEAVAPQDQATSDSDRALIARIRAAAAPLIGSPSKGWPVYFVAAEGRVTLAGHVPTTADQQRLKTLVQQTTGVKEITDALTVAGNVPSAGTNETGVLTEVAVLTNSPGSPSPASRSNAPARVYPDAGERPRDKE